MTPVLTDAINHSSKETDGNNQIRHSNKCLFKNAFLNPIINLNR